MPSLAVMYRNSGSAGGSGRPQAARRAERSGARVEGGGAPLRGACGLKRRGVRRRRRPHPTTEHRPVARYR